MITATSSLFYIFAAILVFAAVKVITARNPVHAALYLVLSFFTAAAIWLLLKAEFLAIALVLVYVGAVMVLFLFVVMMIDFDLARLRQGFWSNLKVALPVGILIIFEMSAVLLRSFKVPETAVPEITEPSNTRALGMVLYTEYFFAFQIAAVLLLLAMVAAIALTLRKRKDAKGQDPAAQVRVRAQDRLRMVSFPKPASKAKDA
ncbi:MAG: NADH-quinone oxidoreductase subunit J [Betaproteobacteria bacterium]|nr:NADH-quinone oxidoreductase subunit J [Betaproteobacteria bacterium]